MAGQEVPTGQGRRSSVACLQLRPNAYRTRRQATVSVRKFNPAITTTINCTDLILAKMWKWFPGKDSNLNRRSQSP